MFRAAVTFIWNLLYINWRRLLVHLGQHCPLTGRSSLESLFESKGSWFIIQSLGATETWNSHARTDGGNEADMEWEENRVLLWLPRKSKTLVSRCLWYSIHFACTVAKEAFAWGGWKLFFLPQQIADGVLFGRRCLNPIFCNYRQSVVISIHFLHMLLEKSHVMQSANSDAHKTNWIVIHV